MYNKTKFVTARITFFNFTTINMESLETLIAVLYVDTIIKMKYLTKPTVLFYSLLLLT